MTSRARQIVNRVIRRLIDSRIIALTIWAPGTFGVPPNRWANLYRIVLPIFDVIIISIGARSIRYGVPAFNNVTGSEQFGDRWGSVLVVAGLACLIGAIFPALLILELWGKILVFAALSIYAGVVQWLSLEPQGGNRSVVASMAVVGVLLSAWRLGDAATERRIRKAERDAAKAAKGATA